MHEQLEIGLIFTARPDLNLSLEQVGNELLAYPSHAFEGHHNIAFNFTWTQAHPRSSERCGLLVLYSELVTDLQVDYLRERQQQGWIRQWIVFPPGTWQDYFLARKGSAG